MKKNQKPSESDRSDCQVHAKVIQNKKLVVLRDQLRKLGKDINKTVDQIDAILGCKGYHDIDEFYPK